MSWRSPLSSQAPIAGTMTQCTTGAPCPCPQVADEGLALASTASPSSSETSTATICGAGPKTRGREVFWWLPFQTACV